MTTNVTDALFGLTTLAARNRVTLPTNAKARKDAPVARGVLDYFPLALLAVANLSKIGNDQHNPGQPMHWAKEKSTDHADCILRHLMERGTIDTDGVRHSAKVAWRALANLQIEIEEDMAANTTAPWPPAPVDPIAQLAARAAGVTPGMSVPAVVPPLPFNQGT